MEIRPLIVSREEDFTERLEVPQLGVVSRAVYDHMTSNVIGQDSAALAVARALGAYSVGLSNARLPIGTFLFTGPTGWGKTMFADELARYLIPGTEQPPITRIQCASYSEPHRVSDLIGSPPGYVKTDELGKLAQLAIDEHDFWARAKGTIASNGKKGMKLEELKDLLAQAYIKHHPYKSIVLWDEVEKAHSSLHNMLLSIIDDGVLIMGDGSVTDMSNSIHILTCNVGGVRQQEILAGKGDVGFGTSGQTEAESLDAREKRIQADTIALIEKHFAPELVGRLRDNIIVFRALDREECAKILELMLQEQQKKLVGILPVLIRFSDSFKAALLDEGISQKYGMRPLRATVERRVTARLAAAMESRVMTAGDEILFAMDGDSHTMRRVPRTRAANKPPKS